MKKKSLNMERFELAPADGVLAAASVPPVMSASPAPPAAAATPPVPAGDVLQRIAAHWKIVALIAIATALIAWMFAALQPKRYRASAIAAVTPNVDRLAVADVLRGVDTLERRTLVATIAALAATPLTHREALGGEDDGYTIDAVVLPNTNLLRVNVEGEDPQRVTTIANRVPELIGAQTGSMYKFYRVTTVSAATRPHTPAFPRVGRTVAAGLLIGLALGAIVAYSIDRRRPAIAR